MARALVLLAAFYLTLLPSAALAAEFSLQANPSSTAAWKVAVTGDLPVVFVAIRTGATGDRRFEAPEIIEKSEGRWTWTFSIPPVPGPAVDVAFVAKDPYAPLPPDERPIVTYCSGRFPVVAGGGPAVPPPVGPGGLSGLIGAVDDAKLARYPRPANDNGWGIHWFPSCAQSPEQVDRFVREAREMHITWVLFLNPGSDRGANQYLVKKLVENGMMPVMRLYYDNNINERRDAAELARIQAMVRDYKKLGVFYFQHLNEGNLDCEWGGTLPRDHVARFCDNWVPVAEAIVEAGGIPGLPGPAFGWIDCDRNYRTGEEYFRDLLAELNRRGKNGLLARSFIALHNYATNRDPRPGVRDGRDGFWEFRRYREMLQASGLEIPMIGGEGGTRPEDVGGDQGKLTDWTLFSYRAMADAPPYLFSFTPWLLTADAGNEWLKHAWIKPNGEKFPIVDVLKGENPPVRKLPALTIPPPSGGATTPADLGARPIEQGPREGETWFEPDGGFPDGGDGRVAFLKKMGKRSMVDALLAKMRSVCPNVGQTSGFTFDCATGFYEILNAMTRGGYAFKDSGVYPPDAKKLDAFRRGGPHMDGGREIGIQRVK